MYNVIQLHKQTLRMENITSSVSPKFQVTIPKAIRKKFPSLQPFSQVEISEKNGVILIKPRRSIKDVIGILGKPPVSGKGLSFNTIRKKAYENMREI